MILEGEVFSTLHTLNVCILLISISGSYLSSWTTEVPMTWSYLGGRRELKVTAIIRCLQHLSYLFQDLTKHSSVSERVSVSVLNFLAPVSLGHTLDLNFFPM